MEKRRLELAAKGDPAAVAALAARHFGGAELDTRDGVKAIYPQGWIHVRTSNTEAILRLIGEAADPAWLTAQLDAAEAHFRSGLV
jgi:phosphomannomutase